MNADSSSVEGVVLLHLRALTEADPRPLLPATADHVFMLGWFTEHDLLGRLLELGNDSENDCENDCEYSVLAGALLDAHRVMQDGWIRANHAVRALTTTAAAGVGVDTAALPGVAANAKFAGLYGGTHELMAAARAGEVGLTSRRLRAYGQMVERCPQRFACYSLSEFCAWDGRATRCQLVCEWAGLD